MSPLSKICPGCNNPFEGRPNAKACSPRCRKRIFRAKQALNQEVEKLAELRGQMEDGLKTSLGLQVLAPAMAEASSDDYIDVTEDSLPEVGGLGRSAIEPAPLATFNPVQAPAAPSAQPLVAQPLTPQPPIQSLETPAPVPISVQPQPQVIGTPVLHPSLQGQAPEPVVPAPAPTPTPPSAPAPFLSPALVTPAPEPAYNPPALTPLPEPSPTPLQQLDQTPYTPSPMTSLPEPDPSPSGPGFLSSLIHRPLLAAMAFVALIVLLAGAFAIFGLLGKGTTNNPTNLASSNSDSALLSAKDSKLTLNLDTVIAKGKSLTLGQLIADPTTGILQLTGDFTASGTLGASGGTTTLNNAGLVINNRTVCTQNGCIPNGSITPVTNSNGTTAPVATGQGGTGTGNGNTNSSNVALLNANQTFTGTNRFSNNSTSAFSIQNANNTSNLLVADTTTSRIGIATSTPAYTLDVNGDINSSTGVRVNGALLCNAGGCTASGGSNNYIQNSTALQTANFNIQSAATTSVTATIRAATGQSADLLQLKDQAGVNIVTIGPTGNTLIQPSTNSINAFSVQNALGTSLLISGDTLNARVAIATTVPPNYTLDVGGDINSSTGLRVGGQLVCASGGGCTAAAGSGSYIQNGTAVQTANFAIQSDLNSHIVAYIRGASGQAADLLDVVGKGAGDVNLPIASFSASGQVLLQNAINSTTAFQVQNLAGNPYLLVNTSGASLSLGNTSIASTIQIGNTTGAVAQSINIGNNATGTSATTVVLGSTIGTSPLTLQAGSTGIAAKTTSSTAFVIQQANGSGTILTADTNGATITLGAAGATPVLLVLGTKNTGDSVTPGTTTCANTGAIYYNSTDNQFRACTNGKLYNLISAVDIQAFTGNGTWNAPSGATLAYVIAVGGGGGGGGGGDGSGGGITGVSGGTSTFGTYLQAGGGAGGGGGDSGSGNFVGGGGGGGLLVGTAGTCCGANGAGGGPGGSSSDNSGFGGAGGGGTNAIYGGAGGGGEGGVGGSSYFGGAGGGGGGAQNGAPGPAAGGKSHGTSSGGGGAANTNGNSTTNYTIQSGDGGGGGSGGVSPHAGGNGGTPGGGGGGGGDGQAANGGYTGGGGGGGGARFEKLFRSSELTSSVSITIGGGGGGGGRGGAGGNGGNGVIVVISW